MLLTSRLTEILTPIPSARMLGSCRPRRFIFEEREYSRCTLFKYLCRADIHPIRSVGCTHCAVGALSDAALVSFEGQNHLHPAIC